MTTSVDVTPDGLLAITADGVAFPPMTIDAVEAAAARIPDARNVTARLAVVASVNTLTGALAQYAPTATSTVTIGATTVTASTDAATLTTLATSLGLTPETNGELMVGAVAVRPA